MQRSSLAVSCAFACVAFFVSTAPASYDPHAPSTIFAPRLVSAAEPAAALATANPAATPATDNAVPGKPENVSADAPAEDTIPYRKPTSLERAKAALAESNAEALSSPELCTKLVEVARANDLPVGFFTNLIWQESRFDHDAISPVGAMGIAQFMPDVAEKMSVDAFDSRSALPGSARLLRTLRARFGNLGLAAAAYNAGPKRVSDWLGRRSGLPKETQDYVQYITGRPAAHWQSAKAQAVVYRVPRRVPCHREMSFASAEQAERMQQEQVVAEEARIAAQKAREAAREAARRLIAERAAERAKNKVVARVARVKLAARVQAVKVPVQAVQASVQALKTNVQVMATRVQAVKTVTIARRPAPIRLAQFKR
jgi:soluble lytic murein transglycosylase-like protein